MILHLNCRLISFNWNFWFYSIKGWYKLKAMQTYHHHPKTQHRIQHCLDYPSYDPNYLQKKNYILLLLYANKQVFYNKSALLEVSLFDPINLTNIFNLCDQNRCFEITKHTPNLSTKFIQWTTPSSQRQEKLTSSNGRFIDRRQRNSRGRCSILFHNLPVPERWNGNKEAKFEVKKLRYGWLRIHIRDIPLLKKFRTTKSWGTK